MIKFFLILLSFSLCYSCSLDKYEEHFSGEKNLEKYEEIIEKSDFSLGEIIDFPRTWWEDFLVSYLEKAQKTIFIEIYSWTKNEKIFTALKNAKSRWVDIRVILEPNVYGSPTINIATKKFLEEQGIPVQYADNERFTFTHAKFWIIDNDYFISTGNWTKSFFSKNREYIFHGNDNETREFLRGIFFSDFYWKPLDDEIFIPSHMVFSPINSRPKIENFISETQNEIFLYVQTISDENILKKISEVEKTGKKIFICTADNEASREASKNFEKIWKFAKNPYLHAKIMIADDEKIFLGSQNFTTNSLENNREMGIFISHRNDLYNILKQQILEHCQD